MLVQTNYADAFPWLVADIGGTNARFGWVAADGAGVADIHRLPVAAFSEPFEAAACYLDWLNRGRGVRRARRPSRWSDALDAPAVIERGLRASNVDSVCTRVLDIFCGLLGASPATSL